MVGNSRWKMQPAFQKNKFFYRFPKEEDILEVLFLVSQQKLTPMLNGVTF